MGDPARFRLMADLVMAEFPRRDAEVVDVAGGKGYLKAELYRRGYRRVTCWDRRRRHAKGRPGQRYQLFDHRTADRRYGLVVAMHPDEATDHAILYAAARRVPIVVCPCCIKPSVVPYANDRPSFDAWNRHLVELLRTRRMRVRSLLLPMAGRNVVLIARPE